MSGIYFCESVLNHLCTFYPIFSKNSKLLNNVVFYFRRKYTELKAGEPGLKLVPLLLREWEELYPASQETVRSFLLRIRFLKSNKEIIKLTLGQHDLLPKMSQVTPVILIMYYFIFNSRDPLLCCIFFL